MFVQANDGKLYENPIIEPYFVGNRNSSGNSINGSYYIKITDMERPMIVVSGARLTVQSSRRRVLKILKTLGIKAKVDTKALATDYLPSISVTWEFDLLGPICMPKGYDSVIDYPRSDSKFLAWEMTFANSVIINFLDKDKYHSILIAFMLGKEVLESRLTPEQRTLIKKSIEKQIVSRDPLVQTIKLKTL